MVVVALYGNFRAFAGDAGYCTDADESVVDFGYFKFEQTAQEVLGCARYDDAYVVIFVLYGLYHGADILTFAEEVARYGFGTGQKQFIVFRVEQQCLFAPGLVYLSVYEFTLSTFELCENGFFLKVEDF